MHRLLVGSFLLFAACAAGKSAMNTASITGEVRELKGDFMPSPDVPRDDTGQPLQTTVVFTGPVSAASYGSTTLFKQLPASVIRKVRTDAQGRFQLSMKPGVYSVFVKVKDGWYANLIQDDFIHPVRLTAGETIKLTLRITLEATF